MLKETIAIILIIIIIPIAAYLIVSFWRTTQPQKFPMGNTFSLVFLTFYQE